MKPILFVAMVAAGAWLAYRWLQKPAVQAAMKTPENYAKSLAEDEKRAIEAARKANEAIQRSQQAVNQVVEEGERK